MFKGLHRREQKWGRRQLELAEWWCAVSAALLYPPPPQQPRCCAGRGGVCEGCEVQGVAGIIGTEWGGGTRHSDVAGTVWGRPVGSGIVQVGSGRAPRCGNRLGGEAEAVGGARGREAPPLP